MSKEYFIVRPRASRQRTEPQVMTQTPLKRLGRVELYLKSTVIIDLIIKEGPFLTYFFHLALTHIIKWPSPGTKTDFYHFSSSATPA